MERYIATFFSHFGAVRFKKLCDGWGWTARMMPVPRTLSSSCGTCVYWQGCWPPPSPPPSGEIEQVVQVEENAYHSVWRAEDS